jgi:hypothetical protein
MQLAATTPAGPITLPAPTAPGPDLPPRSLSMRLDMPIWDSGLPVEAERLDNQLEAIFRMDGIRESGDFDRAKLHEYRVGWTKRFDDLEALRGAILLHAPSRGADLDHAVRFGRDQLAVLEAADVPGATRAQLEAADSAIIRAHNEMSELRWGVPADVRSTFYITPGDIARSRVRQFDGDGDSRIEADEFELVRRETEMVFGDPRTYEQTFSAARLFSLADEQGARDGRTTVREIETVVAGRDSNQDGWLTEAEFRAFERELDAYVRTQQVVGPRFPG